MKKLYRSQHNRKVAGVLGGLAQYINMDATLLRVLFIILMFATAIFPFVLGYIIAMLAIPKDPGYIEG
ncbi:PspC domain-containing protein [Bacillus solimangrovi]|uniref:Phage shock protein PspC N-terminal domain-containing protein n=1 Tax=Bacillus solimangrovi TaxID=1305675 RepID=A0A1E5LDS9_9BACI|nr:PspC domain-containing protein [Bacillus solimangrovi]OEH92236.1 hypothetical protein BFG57_02920 [Bacillus solimangrovi]